MKNFSMDETDATGRTWCGDSISESLDGMYEFPLDNSYVSNIHRIFNSSDDSKSDTVLDTKLMVGLYKLCG